MSGKDNLIPVRTKEEARERGRNGGIASGKARRKKRNLKNAAKLFLDLAVESDVITQQMKALGISEEDITNQMALIVSMWKEGMNGNVRAVELFINLLGQNGDHELRRKELAYRKSEFEYKKERDAGITQEIEDLEEIEEVLYGKESSD